MLSSAKSLNKIKKLKKPRVRFMLPDYDKRHGLRCITFSVNTKKILDASYKPIPTLTPSIRSLHDAWVEVFRNRPNKI